MQEIGRAYCPWSHAEDVGVKVVEGHLRRHRWGHYDDDRRMIILARGLTTVEARCTLAHEVQHAIARDRVTPFGGRWLRQELLAHRRSAQLLVDPDEYRQAEALYGPSEAGIAFDLHVIPEVVRVWRSTWQLVAS